MHLVHTQLKINDTTQENCELVEDRIIFAGEQENPKQNSQEELSVDGDHQEAKDVPPDAAYWTRFSPHN